jgi:hypothetical protein
LNFRAAANSSGPWAESRVRRDDRLSALERRVNHRPCDAGAADQLDHDVHRGILHDLAPVQRQDRLLDGIGTRFVERLDRDFHDAEPDSDPGGDEVRVLLEGVKHAAAHGAAADHADVDLFHKRRRAKTKKPAPTIPIMTILRQT